MNLIKSLEKQLAEGKNLVAENGDIFGDEKLQKVALKEYNALVKKKEIDPMEKSFKEFFFDSKNETTFKCTFIYFYIITGNKTQSISSLSCFF